MKIAKTDTFTKGYQKLPQTIQKKTDKQLVLLSKNIRHPSIRAKKVQGLSDIWEGRIDRSYRFTFIIQEDVIIVFRVGPHDEGLGKK